MTAQKGPFTNELRVASGICWNLDQLMDAITEHDQQNEMVKLEVTHGFDPGKKCYRWMILTCPPIEEDDGTCGAQWSDTWGTHRCNRYKGHTLEHMESS